MPALIGARRAAILARPAEPPVVDPGEFLAQEFPTPLALYGTVKENSLYGGPCLRVRRVDNDAETDIGWNGRDCDAAALAAAISGTTGRLAVMYDQMGANNLTQADETKMPAVLVDVDGKVSIRALASGKAMESAATALKIAAPHVFIAMNLGYDTQSGEDSQVVIGYTSAGVPSGPFYSDATFWGFAPKYGGWANMPRNGQTSGFESIVDNLMGNGHRGDLAGDGWHIWDYLATTQGLRHDGIFVLSADIAAESIVYPSTQKLMVGNSFAYDEPLFGKWRGIALYDGARADRNAISALLVANQGVTPLPTQNTTADGFTWTPKYVPTTDRDPVDSNGIRWWYEHGGYPWSHWKANNVNNGVEYVRFSTHPGDSDILITDAERSERGGYLGAGEQKIAIGDTAEVFMQWLIEPGALNAGTAGGWVITHQIHYTQSGDPDLVFMRFPNDVMQWVTQGNGGEVARGSAAAISRDVWYATRIKLFWSPSGTADTLEIWQGVNGTTLTKIVDATGTIFDTSAGNLGYPKQGLYFGGSGNNICAMRYANHKFSFAANAFASFVTTQPPLPTHA